jgi:hypothetical protein
MRFKSYLMYAGLAAFLWFGHLSAFAQPQTAHMRANITGAPGDGKCTFEVEVDETAEVEIHGDQGELRTLSGRPSVWRRLVCNQPLPNNPVGFRFQGIDGRGRQQLVRDPNSSGGVAVIRIEDPRPGSEGYTGDIMWRGGDYHFGGVGNWSSGHPEEQQREWDQQQRRPDQERDRVYRGRPNEWGQRISVVDALNICRNQVVVIRNVPLNRVRATPAEREPDGDVVVNFTFVNAYGRTKSGFCKVSGTGQILELQVEQNAPNGRVSWNQALELCQQEAAKTFGIPVENVRVQHGADPGNGSFLINYQAQERIGRIRTGVCRVSAVGEIEEFRRW